MRRGHLRSFVRKAAWLAAAIAVAATLFSSSVNAGIEATKHNLSASGPSNRTEATTGICVFCHTPHGSNSSAVAPLWNRALPDPATFTIYDSGVSPEIDAPVLTVGSISLACLSCHDGSQALDTIINAPGAGGYVATAAPQGWLFTSKSQLNDGSATAVGKDLTRLHPVGVRYAGGDGGTSGKLPMIDVTFKNATYNPTRDYWWLDTEQIPNGIRNGTDLFLYTRDFSGTPLPSVECGSCHNPHTEENNFLRIKNSSSALCETCHNN